jgi:hypothetical protein
MKSRICLPANVTDEPSAGTCAAPGAIEAAKSQHAANRHRRDFVSVNLGPYRDA